MTKEEFFNKHFNDEYEDVQGNEFKKDLDDVIISKQVGFQQVCDDCCNEVKANNQYVQEVFEWLINNRYTLNKE